ncbi:MAG: YqaA family protein [Candidatus Poseidoniaceae archaeon]
MSWKEAIVDWFDGFGWISLAAMSFTEAIIQPVPPDLLFLPMLVAAEGDTALIFWLWIVVTVSSVLGSIIGYGIGRKWGRSVFTRFKAERHLEKIEALTIRYGTVGTFIAAFSPIPYKVFGWAAGMGEMKMKPFIIAGLLGRGLRFGLEALLIGIYGKKALDAIWWLLDREVLIGAVLIITIGLTWVGIRWWNGLSVDPNIHE